MNNKAINVWEILGIEPTKSKKEIKRAYASMIKDCHPEEKPEEFEALSKAYRAALAYAEMSTADEDSKQNIQQQVMDELEQEIVEVKHVDEMETVIDEDKSVTGEKEECQSQNEGGELLALIKEQRKQEMAEALSNGIMREIVELLENKTSCNNSKEWSELFLKDEFLEVQCDDSFLELLFYYLRDYTEVFSKPLPEAFMIEISIAYTLILYEDGYAFEQQYVNGQGLIAQIWNSQPEEWIVNRGCKILWEDYNEAKRRAYQGYFDLKGGCIREEIHGDRVSNTLTRWDAGSHCIFYELNKIGDKLLEFQASAIIIKLYDYLLRTGIIPFHLVCYFYKRWHLRENETSEAYIYYKDIKNTILKLYPDIEYHLYKDEKTEKIIKNWVSSVNKHQEKYSKLCEWGLKYYPEPEDVIKGVEEGLKDPIWKKYCEHQYMLECWDNEYWHFYWPSEPLTKALYEVYKNRKFDKNPTAQKMLTKLTWGLLQIDKEKGIEIDRFWPYFIMHGFGITTMPIGPHMYCRFDNNSFIRNDIIYLPEYINYVYEINEYIPEIKEYKFDLGEFGVLGIKCNSHSIEYTLNGNNVYPRSIPYEEFMKIVKNVSDAKAFFALFALADIHSENREEAKELARTWLYKTSLLEGNYEVITECLVNGDPIWKNATKFTWQDNGEEGLLIRETGDVTMTYKYDTKGWLVKEEGYL